MRRPHWLRWPIIIALVAFLLASEGCEQSTTTTECQKAIEVLSLFHSTHLSNQNQLNNDAFNLALAETLRSHELPIDGFAINSQDPQVVCRRALEKMRQAYPMVPVSAFSVEALDYYVRQFDPHSGVNSDLELAGQISLRTGFGFTLERVIPKIQKSEVRAEIVDLIAGSPAHTAGLREGMFVRAINGITLQKILSLDHLAGDNDSGAVSLTAFLESPELELEVVSDPEDSELILESTTVRLKRDRLLVSPLKIDLFRVKEGTSVFGASPNVREFNLAYVKFRDFSGAMPHFAEWLKSVRFADALIVDLRHMPGGDLGLTAEIADLLVPGNGTFAGLVDRNGKMEYLSYRNEGSAWSAPIVVMVNASTKSAAEALAAALQDAGATVIGERTFGKGTRQSVHSLADVKLGARMYVTDAFVVRPSGRLIQFDGITPDISLDSVISDSSLKKHERNNFHAIEPVAGSSPLPGYWELRGSPQNRAKYSRHMESILGQFTRLLRKGLTNSYQSTTEDDLHLEAAKRTAIFLVRQQSAP